MPIKKLKPTSPARRYQTYLKRDQLTKGAKPEKSLLEPKKRISGRNNDGRITVRRRGGGHKRFYRIIDFKRNKIGIPGKVTQIEYDPNRSAHIALIAYLDGEKRYILAPANLEVGQMVESGPEADILPGNALPILNIPLGTEVHNIEMRPGQGAVMARSAGAYAQLVAREGKYATLKLPSGEVRMILLTCMATIGVVSNGEKGLENSGKAGRSRWYGRRPRTRPVAMNPVDHPMGGGEGKSSGGHPRSRNGMPAKGYKTRSKTKASNKYIVERRKK